MELVKLGCDTPHQEQKFVQGLNEYLGQPRDYFFHGDHVLCMAQGLYGMPSKRKWDTFFLGMTLMRFVENPATRTFVIVQKEFGHKEWVPCRPHVWDDTEDVDMQGA